MELELLLLLIPALTSTLGSFELILAEDTPEVVGTILRPELEGCGEKVAMSMFSSEDEPLNAVVDEDR